MTDSALSPDTPSLYTGRFAPSPTGPLHFGSLLAALASYLDARAHHGRWLIRIEDLDPPREDPTAADSILRTLEAYGFEHDGEIRYQSQRHDAYQQNLDRLIHQQQAFPCQCSRKQLDGKPHHGNCHCCATADIAWRFLAPEKGEFCFDDGLQGRWCEDFSAIGDFVLKRRDGPWSYQLAVISDDIDQGITHIVRGIDLIDSTARQALLYQALNQPLPAWSHIPVALEANGQKLSKQNLARPIAADSISDTLFTALLWLRQQPPQTLRGAPAGELLSWAIAHWRSDALKGLQGIAAPDTFCRD
ncbi:MAG: tRNA glutamyl-Q(34) synthetase GluQRS [Oceanospirillaceae bacterium]|uniref:tRNA glutamyl-Q(34) synthetase GluQRS n=1 Tax=unclassified Thalassolituus TaxID=2624967 RepID=UPI000C39B379|nr:MULTISPECIES: tRNA glutamyl-Q(34) synthetase GluQRS [unclassified Thalassolituus]MAS23840.1 tRNA glutamyl-Q(34) synthetase GluQRS [Oceanospirillaceae bacterium]MBL33792.1 tRNA glutamyl-Q(34) synthetase GluQRS [Oceanospirillaceae bacterium]MBS53540.1 tRNA glutamyl-Q(34) synthetase GluQRS [Oceanospirillaceae bacterium]|tara:strand:- start:349 stop:1257 length:909 start_codon:yes stop_codon:yes gene_type:complete